MRVLVCTYTFFKSDTDISVLEILYAKEYGSCGVELVQGGLDAEDAGTYHNIG